MGIDFENDKELKETIYLNELVVKELENEAISLSKDRPSTNV